MALLLYIGASVGLNSGSNIGPSTHLKIGSGSTCSTAHAQSANRPDRNSQPHQEPAERTGSPPAAASSQPDAEIDWDAEWRGIDAAGAAKDWESIATKVERFQNHEEKVPSRVAWKGARALLAARDDVEWQRRWTMVMLDVSPRARRFSMALESLDRCWPLLEPKDYPWFTSRLRVLFEWIDGSKSESRERTRMRVVLYTTVLAETSLVNHQLESARAACALVEEYARAQHQRSWIPGIRGGIALALGQVDLAAAAFTEQRQCIANAEASFSGGSSELEKYERTRAYYSTFKNRLDLYLATGQVRRLDLLMTELDASPIANEKEFVRETQLRRAMAYLDEERLRPPKSLAQSRSYQLFSEIVADTAAPKLHHDAALLRQAHVACLLGETEVAATHLASATDIADPRDRMYEAVIRNRVANVNGGDVVQSRQRLQEMWGLLLDRWGREGNETSVGHLHFFRHTIVDL